MYMLTTSHIEVDELDESRGTAEERIEMSRTIGKRRDTMTLILFIVSVFFMGLSFISFCFKLKYKGYVGRGVSTGIEGSSSDRLLQAEQEVQAEINA